MVSTIIMVMQCPITGILLYIGENGCTMNVHSLRHLVTCVRNWGPLWAYSCFTFESFNGLLKSRFHGTRCMNFQVRCESVITMSYI